MKAKPRTLTRIAAATALVAALAACGSREELKPAIGQTPPALPVGAKVQPTTEELTTPDAQARPARSDELLKRSEVRDPDDFDLPPTG